jgi:hypothetical protein
VVQLSRTFHKRQVGYPPVLGRIVQRIKVSAARDSVAGMELIESPPGQDNSPQPTLDEVASRIVSGAGRLAAATGAWLLLVADFDSRDGAWKFGMASTAQWLAFHCGIAARTANDHVRVGRALAAFPKMAEAMAAGRLSYSQARAIGRVGTECVNELYDEEVGLSHHLEHGKL